MRITISCLISLVLASVAFGQNAPFFGSNTAQTGPSGIAVTACGNMSTASAVYYLQNDVSSTGTCMSVTANGVTLNLNGHTITYGTSSSSAMANGILGVDCGEPMWTTS